MILSTKIDGKISAIALHTGGLIAQKVLTLNEPRSPSGWRGDRGLALKSQGL